ncbi:amino acid racemase [Pseudolysobacter antarcticus]|uniref:Amino acid racemase n=1 Tax=Pseudolysobacter antarcticus TaxID=2511995 RepID=A0A411HLD6_9GAMM|nr:amino acid racemase [Pseudolysobacter antarcticus]QBB71187.1 amino acid racemase [Pseudolysobacter antarcticus]
MKKVGLVGGISWVSTLDYYRFFNEEINARLGGLNFAECMIYSLNFADVQDRSWNNSYELLLEACESLKRSGSEAIALCANTAHMFASRLQSQVGLPIINIVTETAKSVVEKKVARIGLLGTIFTMEMEFYRKGLEEFGLEVLIPEDKKIRDYVQETVKEELGRGLIRDDTKRRYISIVNELVERGAEGLILGCTEIPLLISQRDFDIPVFDTTRIHVDSIVKFALS